MTEYCPHTRVHLSFSQSLFLKKEKKKKGGKKEKGKVKKKK